MGKRKRVPEKLHFELTEYSSLLRALRTSSALDVTSQLTRPPPNHWANHSDDEELGSDLDDDDDEEDVEPSNSNLSITSSTPVAGPSDLKHPSNAAFSQVPPASTSQKAKRKPRRKPPPKKQRDTWTRWPLPVDDVIAPEWNLEDEVTLLAAQALKRNPPIPLPVFPHDDGDSTSDQQQATEDKDDEFLDPADDDDEPLPYIPYLVSSVTACLAHILDIIATHTPARAPSLQNRIEPIKWHSMLNALAARGNTEFMDAEIMQNVSTRLQAVYGEPDKLNHAVHRIQANVAAKKKLSDLMTAAEASIFKLPPGLCYKPERVIRVPPNGRRRVTAFDEKKADNRIDRAFEFPHEGDDEQVAVGSAQVPEGATRVQPLRRSTRWRETVVDVPLELSGSLHEEVEDMEAESGHDVPEEATPSPPPPPPKRRKITKAMDNHVVDVPPELDGSLQQGDGEDTEVGSARVPMELTMAPPLRRSTRTRATINYVVDVPLHLDDP